MKKLLAIIILFLFISPSNSKDLKELEEIIDTIISEDATRGVKKARKNRIKKTTKKTAQKIKGKPQKKEKKRKTITPPSPDEALLRSGIQLFDSFLYEKAKIKFDKLKNEYPGSPFRDSATIWISKIHMESNRYDDAINELNSIGLDSGEYPTALFNIGETQIKKGNPENAIEFFYKVSSLFPDHELADDALLTLGKLYLDLNKGNQTLEAAIKIIKLYKGRETEDDAYFLLGKIFERDSMLRDFGIARKIYIIFLKKADEGETPHFKNSPLKDRVERDLQYLELTYFKLEN